MEVVTVTDPAYGPKFAMPLSYIVMDAANRDFLTHAATVHLKDALERYAERGQAIIVERAVYVDCVKCRKVRIEYAEKVNSKYFDSKLRKDQTSHAHQTSEGWCGHCQGTGWVLESPAAAQKRHQYVTAEMRLHRMTIPEIEHEVNKGVTSEYDRHLINKVLLARLKEAVTPLSQRT